MVKPGCKEYFWLLCKLVDNIHIKDASQVCYKKLCNLIGVIYTIVCA